MDLFSGAEAADLRLQAGEHVKNRSLARAAMTDQSYLHRTASPAEQFDRNNLAGTGKGINLPATAALAQARNTHSKISSFARVGISQI
jgi:hypothetical protein